MSLPRMKVVAKNMWVALVLLCLYLTTVLVTLCGLAVVILGSPAILTYAAVRYLFLRDRKIAPAH